MTENKIMCFRAIDYRDRIRDPFLTFNQALEALQAREPYAFESQFQILCYLKNGEKIEVPVNLYTQTNQEFESEDAARAPLNEAKMHHEQIKNKTHSASPDWKGFFMASYDEDEPFENQVAELMKLTTTDLVSPEKNERVNVTTMKWLESEIKNHGF